MMLLTARDYDTAEKHALLTAPNRIVECSQPGTFLLVSYPTQIQSEKAALRYADVMQEHRSEDTVRTYLGGITTEEMNIMRSVAGKVAALTQEVYGRRIVPRSSLLRSLNVVRHIRYVHPTPNATILEIGPGSGYVGALLVALGYQYICTDITQAFYVWQNHLLNWMADGDVAELATSEGDVFASPGSSRVVHVPWWKFFQISPAKNLHVDLITCNHALCEMHANALRYSLRVAHEMLRDKLRGCFLFEGWGSTVQAPISHAGRALAEAGFVFAHNDMKASVAVRADSELAKGSMRLPHANLSSDDARFHPHIHITEENIIGRIFKEAESRTKQMAVGTLNDFDEMLRRVLGSANLDTDDERFMGYVSDRR